MTGRRFDVVEFLTLACRCPCCRQPLAWAADGLFARYGSSSATGECRSCRLTARFALDARPNARAKGVMSDWAALVELPQLKGACHP